MSFPAHLPPGDNASSHKPDSSFMWHSNPPHRGPHSIRRIFIGPMPEKVVSHMENEVKKQKGGGGAINLSQLEDTAPEKDDDVLRVLKNHARRFVGHYRGGGEEEAPEGGREGEGAGGPSIRENRRKRKSSLSSREQSGDGDAESRGVESSSEAEGWDDDDDEQNVVDELIHKWKESEWGKAWGHRQNKKLDRSATHHWIGGSFEVGNLLGVNMLNPPPEQQACSALYEGSLADKASSYKSAPATFAGVGASSMSSGRGGGVQDVQSLTSRLDSKTGLLSVPQKAQRISNDSDFSAKVKGKQRQVHYAASPPELNLDIDTLAPPPAHPQAVLSRTESQLDPNSSQAAMLSPSISPSLQWGDVLMRDRMLVRITYSKLESLSPKFDDSINRTTRDLQFEDWAEFMVVWRKDFIELYEDHSLPGKELFSGHKHLAYVVPLKSSRTNLSLYSFVDLSFCITCPPMSTHEVARRIFRRSAEGTNIFIFKHKNRSRAWDWTWQLWRHLGGQIPPTIEISNPRLNSTVTIDIPYRLQIDNQELYAMFTRENIVQLCMESLRSVPDWFALAETELTQHGKRLELCWRRDANLDWLWMDEDVYGKSRPWATLAGLAVKQSSRPAVLEIRLTSHAPTHYFLKNEIKLEEPPSIEGYVQRIRPNTQVKQSLYLSTHDGLLFTNSVHEAYPPSPPGLALTMQDVDSWAKGLRQTEFLRGANQAMHANGVCDLRSIAAVRRAFQVVPPTTHDEKGTGADESAWFNIWSQEESVTLDDDEDEGGEHFLNARSDKTMVRMRRCFELLLNTGNVIRFETNSRKVAIEWVNRLRALVGFWKQKKRISAKEEIELAQARRPRVTPQSRVHQNEEFPPEPPADLSGPFPAMEHMYNWCIIEGCQPVTKVSKLHMRKGLRGPYRLVYMALVAGHLVRFRVKPSSALHQVSGKKINLLDANVFSGYFAAVNLPSGQFQANQPASARRYLDGLETDDRDEDMLFMIWFRPHPAATDAAYAPTIAPATAKSVPALSAKSKMYVFRTRSRIERDAWCWALNTEIEKISRVQSEREEKLKETGTLIDLK